MDELELLKPNELALLKLELELLKTEYLKIQSIYEDFDDRALIIKGWSITVGLVGLAKAVELKNSTIAKLSAAAVSLFWIIEAMWKGFQQAFVPRIEKIEAILRTDLADLEKFDPLQIFIEWGEAGWWVESAKFFLFPHVSLPHAAILIMAIYLARKYKES